MVPDVRNLFPQMEQLNHMLICPAISYEAERSLSALTRLKT